MDQAEKKLGYPCFVKPANSGSSVGVSKAKNREDLEKALFYAAKYDRKVIMEEAVDDLPNAADVLILIPKKTRNPATVQGAGNLW